VAKSIRYGNDADVLPVLVNQADLGSCNLAVNAVSSFALCEDAFASGANSLSPHLFMGADCYGLSLDGSLNVARRIMCDDA